MPNLNEASNNSLGTPRSPRSTSTDSSRRSSLRGYYPEKDLEPVSTSPRMRLTRKRAASLDVDSANQPRIGDLALDSTNAPPSSAGLLREQVCLCQPEPKIPRPRNAFILYRQHMQSQVVTAHPGLANPEISKIIGEQWKNQTPEVKSTWKQLAEEEKQRHSRQYPGYRYQPRRAGKPSGIHSVSAITEGGPTRCPKCNGRYISTPSTPLTPYTPVFKSQGLPAERAPPPFTSSRMAEPERSRYPPQMQPARMDSPRMSMPPQQMQHRRMQYPPQHMPTHHERDDEMELLSPTQEQKRRRYNEAPRYSISSPTHYSQQQQAFGRPPQTPMSSSSTYRQPQPQQTLLPGPNNMMTRPPPLTAHMGPPSQAPRHPYPTRSTTTPSSSNTHTHSNFDESLRLPPLQTQLSLPHSASHSQRTHSIDSTSNPSNLNLRDSRARSVEAMVMTIPYIRKIKTLHQISPPLAAPGPSSPAQETRGPVIAVEGSDPFLLREVGAFIEETLRGDSSFCVRSWGGLGLSPSGGKTTTTGGVVDDVEMTDSIPEESGTTTGKGKGKEKITASSSSLPQVANPSGIEEKGEKDPFVEYLTLVTDMHRTSHQMTQHITTIPQLPPSQLPPQISPQSKPQIPIALLPHGFSLTTSNTFSSKIPINDSYAPLDHWQWMATLWRGIVGPDLTVYVMRVGREEWGKFKGVEVRAEIEGVRVGVVVVRILDEEGGGGGGVDEKTRRRLGFEVLEFVRSGEGGWGRV